MSEKQYLTVVEAAEREGVERQAILHRIKNGSLPARRFGRMYMIDPADLDKWRPRKPGPKKGK